MKIICCRCSKEYNMEGNLFDVENSNTPILKCPHCEFEHALRFFPIDKNVEQPRYELIEKLDLTSDYFVYLEATRIANSSRVDQSGVNDGNVVDWVKTAEFIVATNIDSSNKTTLAFAAKLQWRNVTQSGAFADVASTGQIHFTTTTTVLSDDTAVISTEELCVGSAPNWDDGYENENDNVAPDAGTHLLVSNYRTEYHWALDPASATDSEEYAFRIWDTNNDREIGTCLATITMEAAGATEVFKDPPLKISLDAAPTEVFKDPPLLITLESVPIFKDTPIKITLESIDINKDVPIKITLVAVIENFEDVPLLITLESNFTYQNLPIIITLESIDINKNVPIKISLESIDINKDSPLKITLQIEIDDDVPLKITLESQPIDNDIPIKITLYAESLENIPLKISLDAAPATYKNTPLKISLESADVDKDLPLIITLESPPQFNDVPIKISLWIEINKNVSLKISLNAAPASEVFNDTPLKITFESIDIDNDVPLKITLESNFVYKHLPIKITLESILTDKDIPIKLSVESADVNKNIPIKITIEVEVFKDLSLKISFTPAPVSKNISLKISLETLGDIEAFKDILLKISIIGISLKDISLKISLSVWTPAVVHEFNLAIIINKSKNLEIIENKSKDMII